jgi:PIN domain nuclease of toxin-antitoxin system
MKALLDTHAFIWWDSEPARLSPAALALFLDPSNTILVSVVSIWEIIIKDQLGRLSLGVPIRDIISQQQQNGIEILPLTVEHVLAIASLPPVHRAPFDRALVAPAASESAVLVSRDAVLSHYPVRIWW